MPLPEAYDYPGFDHAAVLVEIQKRAGMDHAAIAAEITAMTIPIVVDVGTDAVKGAWLAAPDGDWGKLNLVADGRMPPPVLPTGMTAVEIVITAITARDALLHTATLQASDQAKWAQMQASMAVLVAAGIAVQATADAVLAMPHSSKSWLSSVGWHDGATFSYTDVDAILMSAA